MLEQIFNAPTFDYASRGMAAASLRQEVISNNIANVNTPNFKKSDVVFESLLAKELGVDNNPKKLKMARTHDKHMPFPMDKDKAQPQIELDGTTTMRVDNNNVDIDREMSSLAKNQLYYNALATEMGQYITRIKSAMAKSS